MDNKEVEFEIDFTYKSVKVCKDRDSVFDFINDLPKPLGKKIYELLQENKDKLTFIPITLNESLYACIYKTLIKDKDGETPEFTLYVFKKKEDMLDLLERNPLRIKSVEGAKTDVIEDIRDGIRNL